MPTKRRNKNKSRKLKRPVKKKRKYKFAYLLDMPDEILLEIIKDFNYNGLVKLYNTNQRLRGIAVEHVRRTNIENPIDAQDDKDAEFLDAVYDVVVYNKDPSLMFLLLDAGANVNSQDNNGFTALMFASEYGDTKLARILIDAGADVNIKNNNGDTSLIIAYQSQPNNGGDMAELLRKYKIRMRKYKIGELPSYENIPPPQYIDPELGIIRDRNNRLSNLLEDTQRYCDRRIARLNHNIERLEQQIGFEQLEGLNSESESESDGEIVPFNPPRAPPLSELITDPNIGDPTNLQSFEFDDGGEESMGIYDSLTDEYGMIMGKEFMKTVISSINFRPFLSNYSRCTKLLMLWCLDSMVRTSFNNETELWDFMTANNFSNLKNVLDQCAEILNRFRQNENLEPQFVEIGIVSPVEIDREIIEQFCYFLDF